MDIRKNWMSNNDIFGEDFDKKYLLSLVKDRFDIQRYKSLEGFEVELINDYTDIDYDNPIEQVVIQDFTNPLNEYREDRKIFFDTNSTAKRGTLVRHKDRYWIILTKVESNEGYLSAKITECEHTLSWLNKEKEIQEHPVYITEKTNISTGVDVKKHLTVGNMEYVACRKGVIGLIIKEDQINENYDNIDEGIAGDVSETNTNPWITKEGE
jgi:hypothetical protein